MLVFGTQTQVPILKANCKTWWLGLCKLFEEGRILYKFP